MRVSRKAYDRCMQSIEVVDGAAFAAAAFGMVAAAWSGGASLVLKAGLLALPAVSAVAADYAMAKAICPVYGFLSQWGPREISGGDTKDVEFLGFF